MTKRPRYDDDDEDYTLWRFPVEVYNDPHLIPEEAVDEFKSMGFVGLDFVPLSLPDGFVFGHTNWTIWIQPLAHDLEECHCGGVPWLGTHYNYAWDRAPRPRDYGKYKWTHHKDKRTRR